MRKLQRLGLWFLGIFLVLGAVALWQREMIQVWWYSHRFEHASEADRETLAKQFAQLNESARSRLIQFLHREQLEICDPIRQALLEQFEAWEEKHPGFDHFAHAILQEQSHLSNHGKTTVLSLLPAILKKGSETVPNQFRAFIQASLSDGDQDVRALAIILAQREDIDLLDQVVSLMRDSAAKVRRAAMLAVGPSQPDREPLIATEELLNWLHDPDSLVRQHCELALSTRGLSRMEIHLSRQITDPRPMERLKVLLDLPEDDDFRLEPWLDRLSRDPDSAVRAGSARVAVERGANFDERLQEMIQTDPDSTVRKIAEHYKKLMK